MFKIAKKINKNIRGGFTIVETLVALSIFSISITAMIVVSGQGISNTGTASNKIVADYLAQEGVEIIRNIRDDAIIAIRDKKTYTLSDRQLAWSEFINNATLFTKASYTLPINGIKDCINLKCYIEIDFNSTPIKSIISSCPQNVCPVLSYDSSNGSYGYTTGTTTFFKREVMITPDTNNGTNELKVDSTVHWGSGSKQSVTYSETLFNWPIP